MDDFALPLFESTRILKDNDLICIKKKRPNTIKLGSNGENSSDEEVAEIVEKQPVPVPVPTGMKLLANEEFEKDTGCYQSEPEEGEEEEEDHSEDVETTALSGKAESKKRKAFTKLRSSKRKKNKHTTEVSPVVCEGNKDSEEDVHAEHTTPSAKRFHRLDENGKGADPSHLPDKTQKLPSRSSRRKKAKRRWLREHSIVKNKNKELNQQQSSEKDDQQSPQNENTQSTKEENHIISTKHQQQGETSDVDDDVVPVVIRPGHIRFEPLGKDPAVQQNKKPVETFQWNGITSKKKGQKWGKEKVSYSRRYNNNDLNQEVSEMPTTEEEVPVNNCIDFDKLMPSSGLPKEGDVIAYRLVELTSSWCPEVSSFRVGKISQYDPETNKVTLESVPEHPVVFDKEVDEEVSTPQLDTSLYNEDGSLEVEFTALVDVRIVKKGNLDAAKSVTGMVNGTPVHDKDSVQHTTPNGNKKEKKDVPPPVNGDVNMWDEISEALSAKKALLSQEDGWQNHEISHKRSWSLRGSALGPTMAILRAQNEL